MATKGIAHWRKVLPQVRNAERDAVVAAKRAQLRVEIQAELARPLYAPLLTPIEHVAIKAVVSGAKVSTHWRGVH